MTSVKLMTASATALMIALSGPVAAQQAEGTLPPGQMKQLLQALVDQCEADAEQPNTLNCTLVAAASSDPSLEPQVVDMAESMLEAGVELPGVNLEQFLARGANAQDESTAATADASPAPQPADTAESAVEPQAETQEADAEVAEPASPNAAPETEELAQSLEEEATDPEQAVTADASTDATAIAQTDQETAQDTETPAQTSGETANDDLAQALEQGNASENDTASADQPADPAADTATANAPEVPELDAEAQAAAVAESENRAMQSAAAGAGSDAEEPEARQETVTQDNVRQSTEDFETDVTQAPETETSTETQEARNEDDDDDDGIDPIFALGAAAFGAAVLADILQGDDEVVSNSGDRVVIENNGQYRVLRNDDVLLRRPGAEITTYEYNDGSTRNVVSYDDGTVVETVRAANGQVLRRTRTLQDGTEVVLFDDTRETEQVVVNDLPQTTESGTRNRVIYEGGSDADQLERALATQSDTQITRRFSLNQVRNIDRVRELVPEVTVSSINFETGSAAIRAEEAEELRALGNAMRVAIDRNPGEVFLIEGHTDAVGNYAFNLALSDRRAESVALALTEYFDVPPENMVLQGYGEGDLLIETQVSERANRRAAVRRITPLLQGS